MNIVVPKELYAGEARVALIPANIPQLTKAGCSVFVEAAAGFAAGYQDDEYREKGAEIIADRSALLAKADVVVKVRAGAADPKNADDLRSVRDGAMLIALLEPYTKHASFAMFLQKKFSAFSLERIPRITRAQAMDVLSSMASIAGYKATLVGALQSQKMFPMMMTAAGTVRSAEVFIIGTGVAGLQAIATAKRLGARVRAYDIRTTSKEQVESLGAKFVEFDLKTEDAEAKSGYAKEMDEAFYQKQRALMTAELVKSDVIITTAAIPGKKAPILISEEMVHAMRSGSVIVDLAAERGGNCKLTKKGKTITVNGVHIVGPSNIAASAAFHASQMFSKNISAFLMNLISDNKINIDLDDDIVASSLVCRDGSVSDEALKKYFL